MARPLAESLTRGRHRGAPFVTEIGENVKILVGARITM